MFLKKRSTLGWAFFFSLYLGMGLLATVISTAGSLAAELSDCSQPVETLQAATLTTIIDGDTLRLANGDKVRVAGINTPELAYDGRPAEFLARQAAQAARQFFSGERLLYLKPAVSRKDRYGRVLAHVYNSQGKSLSTYLLRRGLAWQVVVPPSVSFSDCYAVQEWQARKAGLGVWSSIYPPVRAEVLIQAHAGFRVVTGKIDSAVRSRQGWWLTMGRLAISVSDKDRHYFEGFDGQQWLGRTLTLKAWVIDRSESAAVRKKGFKPFMAHWRHPVMRVGE